jgi:DNA-directed RNA polymerase subunit RPC12/RpoP
MSVNLQTSVYVEGYCLTCKAETYFWARMLELEMQKNIRCTKCHEGEICVTLYDTRR